MPCAFNRSRGDRWVFDDRDSGTYCTKFAWSSPYQHFAEALTASYYD
jgi:hypothetical protein